MRTRSPHSAHSTWTSLTAARPESSAAVATAFSPAPTSGPGWPCSAAPRALRMHTPEVRARPVRGPLPLPTQFSERLWQRRAGRDGSGTQGLHCLTVPFFLAWMQMTYFLEPSAWCDCSLLLPSRSLCAALSHASHAGVQNPWSFFCLSLPRITALPLHLVPYKMRPCEAPRGTSTAWTRVLADG